MTPDTKKSPRPLHPRVCTLQVLDGEGALQPPCRVPMTPIVVGVGDEGDDVYWYCEEHDRTTVPDWGSELFGPRR